MQYEIHIGKAYDLCTKQEKPKQVMIINEDQRMLIETFADTEIDEELRRVYILNKCRFIIQPHFAMASPDETKGMEYVNSLVNLDHNPESLAEKLKTGVAIDFGS